MLSALRPIATIPVKSCYFHRKNLHKCVDKFKKKVCCLLAKIHLSAFAQLTFRSALEHLDELRFWIIGRAYFVRIGFALANPISAHPEPFLAWAEQHITPALWKRTQKPLSGALGAVHGNAEG
jgi:hypothetical protein